MEALAGTGTWLDGKLAGPACPGFPKLCYTMMVPGAEDPGRRGRILKQKVIRLFLTKLSKNSPSSTGGG